MDRNTATGTRLPWFPIVFLLALLILALSFGGTAWLLPLVVGACVGGAVVWVRRARA